MRQKSAESPSRTLYRQAEIRGWGHYGLHGPTRRAMERSAKKRSYLFRRHDAERRRNAEDSFGFGTRAEVIKMVPVLQELARHPEIFDSRVCATAQHRSLLDQVLDLFRISPDYDLNITKSGQSPIEITTAVLHGLSPVFEAMRPDWVFVQGDTTTTMAASFAAFHSGIKVGHVETGLRTFDKQRPFPEEMNRQITTVRADLHFAPTAWATANLRREGVPADRIAITGSTVIDAIQGAAAMPFEPTGTPIDAVPINHRRIIVATSHRRENFGASIDEICLALKEIALHYPDVHLVRPVHLDPHVRGPVWNHLSSIANATLLPPLDYLPLGSLLTLLLRRDGFRRLIGGGARLGQTGARSAGNHGASGGRRGGHCAPRRNGQACDLRMGDYACWTTSRSMLVCPKRPTPTARAMPSNPSYAHCATARSRCMCPPSVSTVRRSGSSPTHLRYPLGRNSGRVVFPGPAMDNIFRASADCLLKGAGRPNGSSNTVRSPERATGPRISTALYGTPGCSYV